MSDSVERARELDRLGRRIQVLVLVKTSPTPSRQYEETVCVAGIALNPYRWVRLYPIKFRDYEAEQKFKKYEIIEIGVKISSNDHREESLHIDGEPTVISSVGPKWADRHTYIAQLPQVTLCELRRGAKADVNAQSLAAIESSDIPTIIVEPHPGWSVTEQSIIDQWSQEDLFGNIRKPLVSPRYKVRLRFHCLETSCPSHTISLIDWEVTALQRNFRNDTLEYAKQQFQIKFIDQKFKPNKVTQILVGNQAQGTKRQSFIALGIFGPYTAPLPGIFW